MLEKAVQSAIYEKALKNHYIEILYIDFEDTGKCIKLHQDTKLLSGENIFPESDEQMFDDYICEKIMRYASGEAEDLNRVKQQMTKEAITQGTAEHVMHHVMINFMLNGEMRFMQFDFTRESADTKNVFLFVEDYTDPQQQAFITTLRSIKNSAVLFCVLSEEEDAKTTLCYDPVFITRGFAEVMETTPQQMMLLQKKPFCETVHPDDQQYVEESVRSLNIENPHTNIFYRKRNPQGKWFYMQSDLSYLIVGKKKYIYVTYQDVSALQKNEELSNALSYTKKRDEEKFTMQDSIIRTLALPYENVYVVDIHSGATACYSMGEAMLERYGETFFNGDYEKKISYYIENDVLEEDRRLFDQIRLLKDVEKLLAERNNYSLNYRVFRNNEIKYYQCYLARLNKECNQFIVAFKSIDEEKKQELEQQNRLNIALEEGKRANKALREEMVISEALSQEYHSLLKLDAETGEISLYRTDGFGMKKEMLQELLESHDYAGQILDKYIDNFVAAEDQERVRNATRLEVLKQNVPDQGLYKVSYLRIVDNKYAYYEMNTIKIKDNSGKVYFVIGMRDVDEKVRMQMKQDKEMEMQREIIEALGYDYFSVLLVEPEKDYVTIFRQRSVNGKSIADLCAKYHNCWSEFIPNYAKERVSDASYDEFMEKLSLDYIRSAKESYISVYEYVSDDGIVYYQIKVAFVQKQDGHRVAVVSTKNIDKIIKKEKQQEEILNKALIEAKVASKAKTDFLFNMSHDIRTPMNAIIGFTNLLEEHLDDKEILLNYIDKIKTANEFLLSVINNVLEMAKIENGKEHLDEANTNMVDFYHTIVTLFHTQMNEKGVIFRHSLKIRHRNVMIDVTKMREILLNILSNALKYTPTGNSVTMTMTELPSEREGYAVYQTIIEDTGIGMSEEFLSHMFEYFSREHTTTESGVSGTGLGTAIVKKLVDLMHGTIDVESKLGEGTKITLKMSHQITENQNVQQNFQNEREYNTGDFTGKRILLAEDNDLNAEIVIAILEEHGLEVERAEDGIVCVNMIEKADADHYDLVLMDIQMPNMDGYEATQLIRQLTDKKKSGIPVIAMTANAFEEDKRNALAAGMDGFLSKPIEIKELIHILQNSMEMR